MVAPKKGQGPVSDKPQIRRRLFTTKLCPNCLSELHPVNQLAGWITSESYYCEKCGYVGSIALERTDDGEEK